MNGVLVQLITGEMLVLSRWDWVKSVQHAIQKTSVRDFRIHSRPKIPLKFSYYSKGHPGIIPGAWIEQDHIAMRTDEPLIAVETDKGDIVHVPIKWLMGGEPPWNAEWSVAYHVNGEAMSRRAIDGQEFLRSVRRTDVKEILG